MGMGSKMEGPSTPAIRRDPYEVLSVSKESTDQEIKTAYRKLALKYVLFFCFNLNFSFGYLYARLWLFLFAASFFFFLLSSNLLHLYNGIVHFLFCFLLAILDCSFDEFVMLIDTIVLLSEIVQLENL